MEVIRLSTSTIADQEHRSLQPLWEHEVDGIDGVPADNEIVER
jgi:hypothetical protein